MGTGRYELEGAIDEDYGRRSHARAGSQGGGPRRGAQRREIQATLDDKGELDGLPFMPEMLAFCGRRLTVHKVAHKLCDYIGMTGMRRMYDAVHLTESRCDGSAHGGCQNACSLYWKEQWLKPVGADDPVTPTSDAGRRALLPLLVLNSEKEPFEDGETRWSCQATEMPRAAPEKLPLKQLGQYREDVVSGNAGVLAVLKAFLVALFNRYQDPASGSCPASCSSAAGCSGASSRVVSSAVVRRRSTWTCSRASWSGSSPVRRSWRRSTRTCSTAGWASTRRCPGSVVGPPGSRRGPLGSWTNVPAGCS